MHEMFNDDHVLPTTMVITTEEQKKNAGFISIEKTE